MIILNGLSIDFCLYYLMEESKRKEIREYLDKEVNPIIRPLVEELVRKRPSNI
jgi:hypothetical protein